MPKDQKCTRHQYNDSVEMFVLAMCKLNRDVAISCRRAGKPYHGIADWNKHDVEWREAELARLRATEKDLKIREKERSIIMTAAFRKAESMLDEAEEKERREAQEVQKKNVDEFENGFG